MTDSAPGLAPITSFRALFRNARWALAVVWSTNAPVFVGLVVSTLIRGALPAGLALFARGLINAFVDQGQTGTGDVSDVLPWLAFGLGLTILEAVCPMADKYLTQLLQMDLNLRVTSDVLVQAARLEIAFFEHPQRREVIERAQQNIADHFARFVTELQTGWTMLLQTVSLVAILTAIEPLVLVILVPFALPYLVFQWRLARRRFSEESARAPQRRWTRYFVSRLTGVDSVGEVKLLALAPLLIDRFRELMARFRDRDREIHARSFAGGSVFAFLTSIAFYVVFVRVVVQAFQGALTVGDIAVFGGATSRLRGSLERAIVSLSNAMEHTLYISNLQEFLGVEPRIKTTGGKRLTAGRGEIELHDVSFTYPGADESALRDVSLHIRPGEVVALVGENGAGKTTLVKLIARLYDPDAGRITFDGTDLPEIALEDLYGQVAFVFQGFGRYEGTAAENIAYGDWRRMLGDQERIEQIARLAGVHAMIEALPQGYETQLGKMFGEHDLSGGQWQKMAVARAFARRASLLILDEPTSNLDARAEYQLFCRFRELAEGRTTILVSHRFTTLSMADRILVMAEGRIVESGTHDELLSQSGAYASLYDLHRRQLGTPVGAR